MPECARAGPTSPFPPRAEMFRDRASLSPLPDPLRRAYDSAGGLATTSSIASPRQTCQMLAVSGELLPSALGPLDRFELVARLGRGSHGVVYEAFDRQQGLR